MSADAQCESDRDELLVLTAGVGIGGAIAPSVIAGSCPIYLADPDFLDHCVGKPATAGLWILCNIGGTGGFDSLADEYWSEYSGVWRAACRDDFARLSISDSEVEAAIVDFHDWAVAPENCIDAFLGSASIYTSGGL